MFGRLESLYLFSSALARYALSWAHEQATDDLSWKVNGESAVNRMKSGSFVLNFPHVWQTAESGIVIAPVRPLGNCETIAWVYISVDVFCIF